MERTMLLIICLCASACSEPLSRAQERRSSRAVYASTYSQDYEPMAYAAIPLHKPVPAVLHILSPTPLNAADSDQTTRDREASGSHTYASTMPHALFFYQHPKQNVSPYNYQQDSNQYQNPKQNARPYQGEISQQHIRPPPTFRPQRPLDNHIDQTTSYQPRRPQSNHVTTHYDSREPSPQNTREHVPYHAREPQFYSEESTSFDDREHTAYRPRDHSTYHNRDAAPPVVEGPYNTRHNSPVTREPIQLNIRVPYPYHSPAPAPPHNIQSQLPYDNRIYREIQGPYIYNTQETSPTILYAAPNPQGGYTYRRPMRKQRPSNAKNKGKNPILIRVHKSRIIKYR